MAKPLSAEVRAKIEEMLRAGVGRNEIARRLKVGAGTVSKVKAETGGSASPRSSAGKYEIAGDSWVISLPKTRIHTEEQLIEHFKIDLEKWTIDRMICNVWEMGYKDAEAEAHALPLYQVKAYLVRNKAVSFARAQVEALRLEAKTFKFKFPAIIEARSAGKSGNLGEISIADAHLGAHIWGRETGGPDYDLRIASDCYNAAVESLVMRMRGYQPERILYVIGNDQQNADNRAGTTERGTQQSMDTRYEKVFEVSKRVTRRAIDLMLGEFGAVDVLTVPGNHDPLSTWHLGDTLSSVYEDCKQVRIFNEPGPRKFYQHGIVGLMFEHGNNGKLADYDRTFAAKNPALWAATKWREVHTGDKHHTRVIEQRGAIVRILSSLRPECAWSNENHYVGSIRAAEGFMWNDREALVGTAVYSVLNGNS